MKAMRIKIITAIVVLGIIMMTAYRVVSIMNEEPERVTEVPVRVETKEVKEQTFKKQLDYEGRIMPNSIEKVSFKSTARLKSFSGEIGQVIEKGTVLTSLDTSDMDLALAASSNQLSAVEAQYRQAVNGASSEDIELARISVEKAQDGLNYLEDQITKIRLLFDQGIVSQSEVDNIELQYDLAVEDLNLAQTNYEKAVKGTDKEIINGARAQKDMAATNVKAKESLIDDAVYTLSEDKVLLEKMYEVGELVPAGYVVALLRSTELKVIVGVSARDLDQVYLGQKAEIVSDSDKKTSMGTVDLIAEIPDEKHFLYEVEIKVDNEDFKVGEIVRVNLELGEEKGIRIPIGVVQNNGIDYVYIAEGDRAKVRRIDILDIQEGYVVVEGLKEGESVITGNLNRIHENSKIQIEVEEDD